MSHHRDHIAHERYRRCCAHQGLGVAVKLHGKTFIDLNGPFQPRGKVSQTVDQLRQGVTGLTMLLHHVGHQRGQKALGQLQLTAATGLLGQRQQLFAHMVNHCGAGALDDDHLEPEHDRTDEAEHRSRKRRAHSCQRLLQATDDAREVTIGGTASTTDTGGNAGDEVTGGQQRLKQTDESTQQTQTHHQPDQKLREILLLFEVMIQGVDLGLGHRTLYRDVMT